MRHSSSRTLFLHIGMHKTGTTALQAACSASRDTLEKHGFVYHRDSNSDINQNHFRSLVQQASWHVLETLLRDALETGPRGDRHLISGEDISYMSPEEFSQLVDLLDEYFDDIHVLAAVRQPFSYMNSAAQEILKEPFSTIQSLAQRPDVSPCYRMRFEKVFLRLKRDHCHLFQYDSKINQSLSEFMNIRDLINTRWENKAMTLGVAALLNAAKLRANLNGNQIGTFEGVSHLLRDCETMSVDSRPFQAPREIAEVWQHQIEGDLNWLKTVWDVPDHFFHDAVPQISLCEFEI